MPSKDPLRRQLENALQRNRDLSNEVFRLEQENANLRLVSPQGDKLGSVYTPTQRAAANAWTAVQAYVTACGGTPPGPGRRRKR